MNLPEEFTEKMKALLGDEYEDFLRSYEDPRHFGLRVNTAKISPQKFAELSGFHLTQIPWVENGYYYEEQDAPARHPFYHAGFYYLQEPSAMTPASILPVKPGEKVLDLCAAPGGKATELGAKLRGEGLLVANDISASRAKALLKNIEVFGIPNAFVTNTTPAKLAEQFPEFFDKILVDAPCSGEGMFRKDPAVAKVWDAQKPLACAKQQKEIISRAAEMLAPGGMLLYSTCTFSPEENEQVIAFLLEAREDMELVEIPKKTGFSDGIAWAGKEDWRENKGCAPEARDDWRESKGCAPEARNDRTENSYAADGQNEKEVCLQVRKNNGIENEEVSGKAERDLRKCVRIWPHKMPGEGHFLALLRKRGVGEASCEFLCANENEAKTQEAEGAESQKSEVGTADFSARKMTENQRHSGTANGAVQGAERSGTSQITEKQIAQGKGIGKPESKALLGFFKDVFLRIDWEYVEVRKGQVYLVPAELGQPKGIPFLRNGLYLGEIRKDRFEPSQSFAMALTKDEYAAVLNLDAADLRVEKYLKGETIEADDLVKSGLRSSGWQLVCVAGYPLGWGKLVNGTLKNKYHAGWRMKQ